MTSKSNKFYTAKYDRVFKTIICDEHDLRFLRLLLEPAINGDITKIIMKKNELPVNNKKERVKYVDLIVEINDKKLIHVELNLETNEKTRFRNYVYFSHVISNNTKRGEKYDEDVDYIHIDFSYGMPQYETTYFNEYYMQTFKGKKYIENVKIIEYNMDYIKANWYNNPKLKYLAMLDMEPKELKVMGKGDEVVMDYKDKLEELNKDEDFQSFMTEEQAYRMQYNTDISYARKQGIEQGIKQGIEQGIEQNKKEMIKSMYEKGLTISDIAEIAKLDEEKVEMILQSFLEKGDK